MSALNVMPLPIPYVTGLGEQEDMDRFDSIKGWCKAPNVTLSQTHKVSETSKHDGNASGPIGTWLNGT